MPDTIVNEASHDRGERLQPGARIDARFQIVRFHDEGGWGEVYEARDLGAEPGAERIALKVLRPLSPAQALRVHREALALSQAKAEGVARLVHSGTSGGRLYIAMAWIDGRPLGRAPWSALQPIAQSLLRTLAQLHDQGIVHRDIKPKNVLLTIAGQPVIIDFGLATGPGLGAALTRVGEAVGTAQYAAPEQLRGGPVDGKADVYALGVMLYELLTGRLPHLAETQEALLEQRLRLRPTPVEQVVASLPPVAATFIDRLLQPSPDQRPTAREALRLLGVEAPPEEDDLPWLGGDARLAAVRARLGPGALVRVGGGSGSGKTRALRQIARVTPGARWLEPGERPFASLRPLLERPGHDDDPERLEAALGEALSRAPLLLADPWERLDPWSRALLEATPPRGGMLASAEGEVDVLLPPLSSKDLSALFTGPDRLLHVVEDAATELHRRTGGRPSAVRDVLRAWRRDGVTAAEGAGLRCGRGVLDRMRAEDPLIDVPAAEGLPPYLGELLGLLGFCWPHTQLATLLDLSRQPRAELLLGLKALDDAGLATEEGDRWRPLVRADLPWTESRRADARLAFARRLAPGSPRRLGLLVSGVAPEEIVEEALALAGRLEREGQVGEAIGALQLAWRFAADPARLLAPLVHLLLTRGRTVDRDQALHYAQGEGDAALIALVQAVMLAEGPSPRSGLAAVMKLAPFADAGLELRRLATLVTASQRLPLAEQEALLEGLAAHPLILADEEHQGQWAAWRGLLRYNQRRFAEAAALHQAAAAAMSRRPAARLLSLVNAGRSFIEAGDLSAAKELGEAAVTLAKALRHPAQEAHATWLVRAVANRHGATDLEPELKKALLDEELGLEPLYLGISLITEAFIALRGRHAAESAELAERAREAFQRAGVVIGAIHAEAILLAAQETRSPALVERAQAPQLLERFPEVCLEVLALHISPESALRADTIQRLRAFMQTETPMIRGLLHTADAFERLTQRGVPAQIFTLGHE